MAMAVTAGTTVAMAGTTAVTLVVTLELVADEINTDFEAWYADPGQAVSLTKVRYDKQAQKGRVEVPILEEHEDPEPIIEGKIDLGELVTLAHEHRADAHARSAAQGGRRRQPRCLRRDPAAAPERCVGKARLLRQEGRGHS